MNLALFHPDDVAAAPERPVMRLAPADPPPPALGTPRAPEAEPPADAAPPVEAPPTGAIQPGGIYSPASLAKVLGVSAKTVARLRTAGKLPPTFKFGRRRYWRGDVLLRHFDKLQAKAAYDAGGL